MFYKGDIVKILDKVDLETVVYGTIAMIEPDNEIEGLYWLYVIANNELLNIQVDPRIGNYFGVYEMDNPYITLASRATQA